MSVDKFGRFDQSAAKTQSDARNAVNAAYVQKHCLSISDINDHYDAKNRTIRNVSTPLLQNDAANMQFVRNYSLQRTSDMQFSANNKFIRELRDPVLNSDAATMGFVNRSSLKRTHPDGDFDIQGKLLRNLGNPVLPTDAVNMEYVLLNTPRQHSDHWTFNNKKLSNVLDPTYDGEAVNLRTLRQVGLIRTFEAKSHYDAKDYRIVHVGDSKDDGDAVNVKVLKDYVARYITHHEGQLERLSSAIFDYIHRSSGRSAELGITNTNYLDWDKILNKKILEEDESEEHFRKRPHDVTPSI